MTGTEYDILTYLCPPIAGLAIVDHVVGAGNPERLVKWLTATVKQKQSKGEEVPNEIMGWVKALDNISALMQKERQVKLIEMWRNRMQRVNSGREYHLSTTTDLEWATVGQWLDSLDEMSADTEGMQQATLIEIPVKANIYTN